MCGLSHLSQTQVVHRGLGTVRAREASDESVNVLGYETPLQQSVGIPVERSTGAQQQTQPRSTKSEQSANLKKIARHATMPTLLFSSSLLIRCGSYLRTDRNLPKWRPMRLQFWQRQEGTWRAGMVPFAVRAVRAVWKRCETLRTIVVPRLVTVTHLSSCRVQETQKRTSLHRSTRQRTSRSGYTGTTPYLRLCTVHHAWTHACL